MEAFSGNFKHNMYYNAHYIYAIMTKSASLADILETVSLVANVSIDALKNKGRKREVVDARNAFMLLANSYNIYTQETIEHFVNKKHGSLFHAQKNAHLKEISEIVIKSKKILEL